jgi:predicted nucleic acid-binding protein
MSFLLDTNVVSEWVSPRPDSGVITWLSEADEDETFLSVITLAELRRGIARMARGRRRARLDEWLRHELPLRFEDRILPIDNRVAVVWGDLVSEREVDGRPISVMDAFIAATARTHDLTLVTRNASDFVGSVATINNPWTET